MTKVWVVSCWLNRSSFDNSVLGVFTCEKDALRLARAQIDPSESYENISEGYYEESSRYNSSIISVDCLELNKVYDQERLDEFTSDDENRIIELEKG